MIDALKTTKEAELRTERLEMTRHTGNIHILRAELRSLRTYRVSIRAHGAGPSYLPRLRTNARSINTTRQELASSVRRCQRSHDRVVRLAAEIARFDALLTAWGAV